MTRIHRHGPTCRRDQNRHGHRRCRGLWTILSCLKISDYGCFYFPLCDPPKPLKRSVFYEPMHQNAFFFINTRNNPEKQLFSLATELGKILIYTQTALRKDRLFPEREPTPADPRPINPIRAARHFAATFLMPDTAVKATVSQLGISPDTWTWELLLRIKHRFGISAQAFLYRLDELNLITKELITTFEQK